jgi:anti-sigma factor RsiW
MTTNNYEDSHPEDSHPMAAQLLLALDGELEPSEATSILRHVESCPVCRAQCEQWKQISERIVEYHHGALQAQVARISPVIPRVEAHSSRSRAKTRVIAAVSGAAAALVCLVWLSARPDRPKPPVTPHLNSPAPAVAARASTSPPPQAVRHQRPHRRHDGMVAADSRDFFALPFSDAALPLSDATVVRVQLPIEELRLTGLAVEGEPTGVVIQADVLLGIDGLPRGIRLVQ